MLTDKYTYKPYRKKHGAIQNCTFLRKMVVLANANLSATMPGCYGLLPEHCYGISSVQDGCLLAQVKQA